MKTYILKLKTTSTTNYNLYDGTTLVSDSDLATLFGSAGSAYFTFDFNEGTPTNTTSLTILNSQDTAVMTNTGLEGIAEDRNFKGVWADSATAFTSFTLLKGVAMDEAELTTLVGMAKNAGGIKTLTTADYNYPTSSPTSVALWLLPVGAYKIPNGVSAMAAVGNPVSSGKDAIAYVNTKTSNRVEITTDIAGYGWATGATTAAGALLEVTIIYGVLDELTSSNRKQPLSANQGRVLNNKIVGTTETATITTTDWTALSDSDPYDYSATITASATIDVNAGVVELLNDQPALFGTYGFAIGAVSGQSVTIYSIGQPDASVSLKLNIRNL